MGQALIFFEKSYWNTVMLMCLLNDYVAELSSCERDRHSTVSDSCDPMNDTVHGILQARILMWVAFPFPRGSSQPRDRTQVSCIAGRFFTS